MHCKLFIDGIVIEIGGNTHGDISLCVHHMNDRETDWQTVRMSLAEARVIHTMFGSIIEVTQIDKDNP